LVLAASVVIAVSHGSSFGHSLLARLDHGVHDRTVWITLALAAVIVAAMEVAVWLVQEYAIRRSGRRR
jgi:hypothetical protein